MTQIQAVIFDYGNVLCQPQDPADLAAMAGVLALDRTTFEPLYWRTRGAYDREELTAEEYWTGLARAAGREARPEAIRTLIRHDNATWTRPSEAMVAWARQLRASGIRTAVLSNMPLALREYLDAECAWMPEFDHRTFSCDVRVTKPDPAIYRHCLEGLSVAAERALFLDDRLENVEAARGLGMHAIEFTDAFALAGQLDGRYRLPPIPPA